MFRHGSSRFDQELVTIRPGEFYATVEDAIISTVLGSCVAVGLFDEEAMVGGLNHFMLPHEYGKQDLIRSPDAKYGMYAMDLLINDLMKLGARRHALKAKVFGGGAVLAFAHGGFSKIPSGNIEFAFEYLMKEEIPLLASDVGGKEARKIFFFARTGKVLLERLTGSPASIVEKEEKRYLVDLRKDDLEGPVVLF